MELVFTGAEFIETTKMRDNVNVSMMKW